MSLSLHGKAKDTLADLDVNELRKELSNLRAQVEKLTGEAVSQGRGEFRRLRDVTAGQAAELLREGESVFGDVSREVGRELRLAERRARETVRERPGQTAAVAAVGLGLLLVYLLRR